MTCIHYFTNQQSCDTLREPRSSVAFSVYLPWLSWFHIPWFSHGCCSCGLGGAVALLMSPIRAVRGSDSMQMQKWDLHFQRSSGTQCLLLNVNKTIMIIYVSVLVFCRHCHWQLLLWCLCVIVWANYSSWRDSVIKLYIGSTTSYFHKGAYLRPAKWTWVTSVAYKLVVNKCLGLSHMLSLLIILAFSLCWLIVTHETSAAGSAVFGLITEIWMRSKRSGKGSMLNQLFVFQVMSP